jgi:hypothetical protein
LRRAQGDSPIVSTQFRHLGKQNRPTLFDEGHLGREPSNQNKSLKMKEWEIWSEGYITTGEHGLATFEGRANGETFEEACINLLGDKLDKNKDGSPKLSIWACRLFPTEHEARASFG